MNVLLLLKLLLYVVKLLVEFFFLHFSILVKNLLLMLELIMLELEFRLLVIIFLLLDGHLLSLVNHLLDLLLINQQLLCSSFLVIDDLSLDDCWESYRFYSGVPDVSLSFCSHASLDAQSLFALSLSEEVHISKSSD